MATSLDLAPEVVVFLRGGKTSLVAESITPALIKNLYGGGGGTEFSFLGVGVL